MSARQRKTACFAQVLEELRKAAGSNGTTRGRLFERLTQSFLQTHDLYRRRFRSVWLWDEYPDRKGRADFGVDIVAEEHDGTRCAIQCKFFAKKTLAKSDIDSFLEAASRKREFGSMMLVYTAQGYGRQAEEALKGHNCHVLDFASLAGSNVEWPDLAAGLTQVRRKRPFDLMPHQKEALQRVTAGLRDADRGQMIMACGTGKTITALRIAERMCSGKSGLVLYAVPSISLMQQSIRAWSEQRKTEHAYVGVCSDPKVGHGETADIPILEMEIGVTTDEGRIAESLGKRRNSGVMTVVFSTYQSMDAVVNAQKKAGSTFDLVICDEAHRTTGVEGDDRSAFMMVHDDIRARKRVYMTATPRVYRHAAAAKAREKDYTLYSMDDHDRFGKELYRLGFSEAIDKKLLSDYRVLVLGVSEKYAAGVMQKMIQSAGEAGDINLTDTARMVGIYKAFQNPGEDDAPNVQTAIVYTNRIRDSRNFAATFERLDLDPKNPFHCDAQHVDGTQNASVRAGALQWLRDSPSNPDECRILTNARCLSEGVDVPALDSICFTNPRTSEVDIIQAVGRVMRRAECKKYGYVIVPIAIPEDSDPARILDNKEAFNTVWGVLRALRSHDEQMDIDVNTADVRKRLPGKISWIGVGHDGKRRDVDKPVAIPLADMDIPSDAIFSKIVDEVGDRQYFERWAKDVANIAPRIQERVASVLAAEKKAKSRFDGFMSGLREIIHDGLTDGEGIEMLAQHMITRRIFDAMFGSDGFSSGNPVSAAITGVIKELQKHGLETELRDLERFYQSIEKRIANLDTHDARQQVISEMYGTFFKLAFPKMAERLGIVYTPVEIVDFILRSVDHASRENFGRGLSSKNVNIIDPFVGTGTFVARLLSKDLKLVGKRDVEHKYRSEIFANEIVLLAYYIAAVNCESAYGQRFGEFRQFEGLSLTDTFNRSRLDEYTGDVMAKPKKGIRRQRKANITVIVGNPPYSVGQSDYNEQNQNMAYPEIDKRVKETYVSKTKLINTSNTSTSKLYDSYIRSLRWASDRIGESGIIGFVTNASFIRSESAAGVRACLQEEFTDVWVFDLRGNQRTQGEVSKKEGGKVFGSGSRAPVAITILVKNPKKAGPATIRYRDIGDYHDRETKLDIIKTTKSIEGIPDWQIIKPDKHHDWLDQRSDEFNKYLPMGSKNAKAGKGYAMFKNYSLGVATHRDTWIYNSSKKEVFKNMRIHIEYCNSQNLKKPIIDLKKVKWSEELSDSIKRSSKKPFKKEKIRKSVYRPFFTQYMYFDNVYNDRLYQTKKIFPQNNSTNLIIGIPYHTNVKFSTFITNLTPDMHVVSHGQWFPLYTYDGNERQENITNKTLKEYQLHYNTSKIQKLYIFYYAYWLLHHKLYRKTYANNLTHEFPHIPMAPDFWAFSKLGKKLVDLHLSYETCKRYDLGKPLNKIPDSPRKIRWGRQKKDPDKGITSSQNQHVMIIDDVIVYENLPVCEYRVNGRTPLEWFVDRYGHTIDKESGIENWPLEGVSGEDVRAVIERLAHVGAESDRLVSRLPEEFEPGEGWKPSKRGIMEQIQDASR